MAGQATPRLSIRRSRSQEHTYGTGWLKWTARAAGRSGVAVAAVRSPPVVALMDAKEGDGCCWLLHDLRAALASYSSAESRAGDSHARVMGTIGCSTAELCRDERRCPVPRRLGGSLTRDLVLRGGGTARGEEMHGRGSTVYSLS